MAPQGGRCNLCPRKPRSQTPTLFCKGQCGLQFHLKCAGLLSDQDVLSDSLVVSQWKCQECNSLPSSVSHDGSHDRSGDNGAEDEISKVREDIKLIKGFLHQLISKDTTKTGEGQHIQTETAQTRPQFTTRPFSAVAGLKNRATFPQELQRSDNTSDNTAPHGKGWTVVPSKRKSKEDPAHAIFVEAKKPEDVVHTIKYVKGCITSDMVRDNIVEVKATKGGAVIVQCNGVESVNSVEKRINAAIGAVCNLRRQQTRVPRACVRVFDSTFDEFPEQENENSENNKTYVLNEINMKNTLPSTDITVLRVSKVGNKFAKIILLVDAPNKAFLLENGLKIGFKSCRVEEHHYLPRCFKCSGFGHVAKNCSRTVYTCHICAGEHESIKCDKRDRHIDFKCVNCANFNRKLADSEQKINENHKAGDVSECESYQRAFQRMIERDNTQ
jgi:hypothetical protein